MRTSDDIKAATDAILPVGGAPPVELARVSPWQAMGPADSGSVKRQRCSA